jgi:hypothetical protein
MTHSDEQANHKWWAAWDSGKRWCSKVLEDGPNRDKENLGQGAQDALVELPIRCLATKLRRERTTQVEEDTCSFSEIAKVMERG